MDSDCKLDREHVKFKWNYRKLLHFGRPV
jgi:hypothetical protein